MKTTLFKTAMLAIALIISLVSCKKDEKIKTNSFNYHQKTSEIGTVLAFQDGESEIADVYGIGLLFFEKTLTVHYKNGEPDSLSGKGDVLVLYFLTDDKNVINSGVYNLNSSTASSKEFTIDTDESGILIDVDSFETGPAGMLDLSSGKVTLVKNGSEYEITLNMNSNVNSTITGYYKGIPTQYDYLKKKSVLGKRWPLFNQVHY
jgi:hypothetical protein